MEKSKIKISLAGGIVIAIVIISTIFIVGFVAIKLQGKKHISGKNTNLSSNTISNTNIAASKNTAKETNGVIIVPTLLDEIKNDSTWCGTFQLVWNDMKNEIVKQNILFNSQEKMVENLNKESFKQEMISSKYYYKIYDYMSPELKKKIEKGIKEKFNQTSDILDKFTWPVELDTSSYFLYAMLYRKFEFLQEFSKLNNDKFGNKHKNVEYFGIDSNTENLVRNQIDVLYYNSKDDFAVLINTKTNDEVILCKNPKGTNFNEIYENMNKASNNYEGSNKMKNEDEFKTPKININEIHEYKELENKPFKCADGKYMLIGKAMQTVKFSIDEKGGEIKSEAAIANNEMAQRPEEPRYFYLDDTFAMFLRERGKEKPYFAAKIDDIEKFQ